MWFFKKKEKESDTRMIDALTECIEFRNVGERFTYLGVEMCVVKHGTVEYLPGIHAWIQPNIHARYVNKDGDIREIVFDYRELNALKKENKS